MNSDTRNTLWNVICDLGKDIEHKISNFGIVTLEESLKDNVFDLYDKYKDGLKIEFMQENTNRIDRHKISACMLMAILKTTPIKNIDKTLEKKPILYYMANEALAVFSALYILQVFLLKSDEQTISNDVKEKLRQGGFVFPYNEGKDYILWLLSVLTKCSGSNTDSVNIMLIANIFFFIEKYTILSYE